VKFSRRRDKPAVQQKLEKQSIRVTTAKSPTIDLLSDALLKRLLKILIAYQLAAISLIGAWVYTTWNADDWTILAVPQNILEWSLIGAIAGALFRLSNYPRLTTPQRASLHLWIVTKPFVSTALGGVVYFLAVGGVLVLNGTPNIEHNEILSAIAFFAAFSDRFALSMLNRLSTRPSEEESSPK
jgi:hypothetical protein